MELDFHASSASAMLRLATPPQALGSIPPWASSGTASLTPFSASLTPPGSKAGPREDQPRPSSSPSASLSGAASAAPPAHVLCILSLAERAARMRPGQRLRPRPLHALFVGVDGKLESSDGQGNPLQNFRLVVLLDDSSARQRCLVDHGLIQRWTGGLTPAQLSMAAEPRRTDLLAPLRALLQKAEGMWHIEFPGGCDSGCLPVIMDMTPGIDNRTTASLLDRCRQLRLWAPAAFPPSNNG